ncbi:hypothetical protein GCM10009096_07850 [Parasphingorhabdus litoris]|uniref:Uncharacterized protein n=1 Tax=Parasphingorhabdus litoris TaxID=394733 RepID=A0ABN1A7B8_9SPHN
MRAEDSSHSSSLAEDSEFPVIDNVTSLGRSLREAITSETFSFPAEVSIASFDSNKDAVVHSNALDGTSVLETSATLAG